MKGEDEVNDVPLYTRTNNDDGQRRKSIGMANMGKDEN